MKNIKKMIEVKLTGLNKLGVQELNEYYKHNISKGYVREFQLGDNLGVKKKRFKQVKSFENLGLENYITNFDCTQLILDESGNESLFSGPYFSIQLKHFIHEIYDIEIIETFTKKEYKI